MHMKFSQAVLTKWIYENFESKKSIEEMELDIVNRLTAENKALSLWLFNSILLGVVHPDYAKGFFHALNLTELQKAENDKDELAELFRK